MTIGMDESADVAVRRVILVFTVGRIAIVAAVTGRSAAVIIAPISIESEPETKLNTFVITVLELAIGASVFGSVEYGIWREADLNVTNGIAAAAVWCAVVVVVECWSVVAA